MVTYTEFLQHKQRMAAPQGIEAGPINATLKPHHAQSARWALQRIAKGLQHKLCSFISDAQILPGWRE